MKRRRSQLTVYPSVDLVAHARAALGGAQYHLTQIQKTVRRWQKTPGADKENGNAFHWHLRAFFWELFAAMETTKLALKRIDSHSQIPVKPKLGELEQAEQSEWWKEVEEWRNFAHRAFLFVQGLFNGDDGKLESLFLPPLTASGPQHMVPDRLKYYMDEMQKLQNQVLPQ